MEKIINIDAIVEKGVKDLIIIANDTALADIVDISQYSRHEKLNFLCKFSG